MHSSQLSESDSDAIWTEIAEKLNAALPAQWRPKLSGRSSGARSPEPQRSAAPPASDYGYRASLRDLDAYYAGLASGARKPGI